MNATEFTNRLRSLTGEEILDVAEHIRMRHESVDGDMAWWKATATVERRLRRQRAVRQSCRISHVASSVVREQAEAAGLATDARDDVICVARAAGDAARALASGVGGEATQELLAPWLRVMAAGVAAA